MCLVAVFLINQRPLAVFLINRKPLSGCGFLSALGKDDVHGNIPGALYLHHSLLEVLGLWTALTPIGKPLGTLNCPQTLGVCSNQLLGSRRRTSPACDARRHTE